jgi:Phage P22-like portal protein
MRPSIRVVPVDSRGDPKTAELLAGLVRYVENRSDARHAYTTAADSQVTCGIGHWRVITEYAGDSTFDQEIRIATVADGVGSCLGRGCSASE